MTMAFEIIGHRRVMGDLYVVFGTFTNAGGETGGTIKTGLSKIQFALAQHTGSAVVADAPAFNNTFPMTDGDLVIVTVDGADGIWAAFGTV